MGRKGDCGWVGVFPLEDSFWKSQTSLSILPCFPFSTGLSFPRSITGGSSRLCQVKSPPYSEFLVLALSSWLWVPTAMRQHSLSSQRGPGSALWSRGLSGAVRASASQSFSWEFGWALAPTLNILCCGMGVFPSPYTPTYTPTMTVALRNAMHVGEMGLVKLDRALHPL